MAYMAIHLGGNNEEGFSLDKFGELYSELEGSEDKEAYVALTHESEWCLSLHPFGILVWENNLSDLAESWIMEDIDKARVIDLWSLLADGHIETIKKEPWIKGDPIYGII